MPSQEQRLLDNLEDARTAYAFHKRVTKFLWRVGISSLIGTITTPIALTVLHGMHIDLGSGSPAIPVMFAFIMIATGCATGLYFAEVVGDHVPTDNLSKAERAYRDYLNQDVH